MATDSEHGSNRRRPTRRSDGSVPSQQGTRRTQPARTAGNTASAVRPSSQARSAATRPTRTVSRGTSSATSRTASTSWRSASSRQQPSRAAYPQPARATRSKQPRRANPTAAIIGVVAIAIVAALVALFWTHRAVAVTLNGESAKMRINSTLEYVRKKGDVVTKPGNYVSVGGNVLEKDAGYAFSAKVNDKELSQEEIESYRVRAGDTIEIANGADRMEEYDVEYRETQPKIVFEGDWGSVTYVKQWGKVGRQEVRTGRESGETADGDWVDELQNCIIATHNVHPEGDEKLVALTFDDGPAATYTEAYLDILSRYGAKATFFNLSLNETEYPELAQKVAQSGNQICSHTNQHLQLSTLSAGNMLSEISSAHDTIKDITGVDTTIIRPPYGDFTRTCWVQSNGLISASIIWTHDSLDWSLPGVDGIVAYAVENMNPGSIILMHDGGGNRDQDVEALPRIIEAWQAEGYRFVTISELLASDPDIPAEIAAGSAAMPADAVWPTEVGEATTSVG